METINFNNQIQSLTQDLNTINNSQSILGQPIKSEATILPTENFLSSWSSIFFLLLIISFLGINVFYVISHGSKLVGDVGSGLFGYFNGLFKWIFIQLKNLVYMTGLGAKVGIDITTKTTESGLDILEKTIEAPAHIIKDTIGDVDKEDILSSGLDIPEMNNNTELQGALKDKKGGYCYIGTDNNVGSCMYVDREDLCMSNQIFPTMELCINKDNTQRS